MRITSLEGKLTVTLAIAALAGAAMGAMASVHWGFGLGLMIAAIAVVPLALMLGHTASQPVARLLRALEGAIASYRDGDFSVSLNFKRRDELGDLARLHNSLGQALREQRQHLTQRELLLETVVQNTPVALMLVDAH